MIRNRAIFLLFLYTLMLLFAFSAYGQEIRTSIGRDSMLIGDTLHVVVDVSAPRGADILFTEIPDTLAGGLELFRAPHPDTLTCTEVEYISRLVVPITAYDSGWFYIPRIPVLVLYNGVADTLYSEGQPLYVGLIEKDEAVEDIQPIVGPMEQGVTFREVLPWLLGALGVLAMAAAVYFLLKSRHRDRTEEEAVDLRPPYEIAMERLQALRDAEAWRNPGVKYFYTEITEALRVYMAAKWDIRTLEETTHNIILQLRYVEPCDAAMEKELKALLELGDLAKFARFAPQEYECIESLNRAIGLVERIERQGEHETPAETMSVATEKEEGEV